MRGALGASRARVSGQLLTEALALSVLSAILGCGLCLPLIDIVHAQALSVATDMGLMVIPLAPGWRGALFASALGTGVLLGLVTAHNVLQPAAGTRGSAAAMAAKGGHAHSRMRSLLLTAPVAASLTLLVLSALIVAQHGTAPSNAASASIRTRC